MDPKTTQTAILVGGVAMLGLVAYNMARKAAGAVTDAVGAVATAANTATAAPVLATGDALGIPRTNMTECEKAMAEGRTMDASFACPAGDFLGYLVKGKPAPAPAASAAPPASSAAPSPVPVSFQDASQSTYQWDTFGGWGPTP